MLDSRAEKELNPNTETSGIILDFHIGYIILSHKSPGLNILFKNFPGTYTGWKNGLRVTSENSARTK